MNWAAFGALCGGVGTLLLGIGAILRARLKPGDPVRLQVRGLRGEVRALRRELTLSEELLTQARQDLVECRRECWAQQDELSEAKSTIIALRNLIPGGEWARRLGLDSRTDQPEQ